MEKEKVEKSVGDKEKAAPAKQKATVGRIVHYQNQVNPDSLMEVRAAIVVSEPDQETGDCQLFLFGPTSNCHLKAPYSDEPKAGHWNWPPRV